MKFKKIDWEVLRHGQEFSRGHIAGFSLTVQISLAGQPPVEEAASTPNSTEVIPLRNRGRPRGKGQRAKGEAEHSEQPPPPKGQLDKEAFKQWKLQLGKNIYIVVLPRAGHATTLSRQGDHVFRPKIIAL